MQKYNDKPTLSKKLDISAHVDLLIALFDITSAFSKQIH